MCSNLFKRHYVSIQQIQHVRDISSNAHRVNVYHLTVDVMLSVTVMTAAMSSIAVS